MPLQWLCLYFHYVFETDSSIWQTFLRTLIPWTDLCFAYLNQQLSKKYVLDYGSKTSLRYICPITARSIGLHNHCRFPPKSGPPMRADYDGIINLDIDFRINKYCISTPRFNYAFLGPMEVINAFVEVLFNVQSKPKGR